MWFGGRSTAIFVSGLVLFALGLVPLLPKLGISIGFTIPLIPQIVLAIVVAAAGIYLMIVGFLEGPTFNPAIAWTSIILGVALAALGVLQTLNYLPAINQALQNTIAYGIFVVVGILFIIGAFLQS
ncbi:MAG: hypothetical protein QW331_00785 [Candidatus Woesearchaeota archaeon]